MFKAWELGFVKMDIPPGVVVSLAVGPSPESALPSITVPYDYLPFRAIL
jgi:hypothetical protein